MSVDFPKPVWPVRSQYSAPILWSYVETATETRTDGDHVELEATLQELVLNLGGDAVETDIGAGANLFGCWGGHGCLNKGKGEEGAT